MTAVSQSGQLSEYCSSDKNVFYENLSFEKRKLTNTFLHSLGQSTLFISEKSFLALRIIRGVTRAQLPGRRMTMEEYICFRKTSGSSTGVMAYPWGTLSETSRQFCMATTCFTRRKKDAKVRYFSGNFCSLTFSFHLNSCLGTQLLTLCAMTLRQSAVPGRYGGHSHQSMLCARVKLPDVCTRSPTLVIGISPKRRCLGLAVGDLGKMNRLLARRTANKPNGLQQKQIKMSFSVKANAMFEIQHLA